MGYIESFKNTFLVDILEYLRAVKIEPVVADPAVSLPETHTQKTSRDIEADADRDVSNSDSTDEKDPFLVDWDGPEDPDNPLNWSSGKKSLVVSQMMLLTCATYMGASIYLSLIHI